MIPQDKIDIVVNTIVEKYSPEKIILFGSYANGTPTEDSDVDLLIIKDTDLPRPKRLREVRKFLRGMKIPLDLIVYNSSEIKKWKDVKQAFITRVLNNGKVLYEQ